MFQYHCLNPIAQKGLDIFDDNYKKADTLDDCQAVLVRSAKMHDMELNDHLLAIARAGAGVNNIPLDKCAEISRMISFHNYIFICLFFYLKISISILSA